MTLMTIFEVLSEEVEVLYNGSSPRREIAHAQEAPEQAVPPSVDLVLEAVPDLSALDGPLGAASPKGLRIRRP